MGSLRGDRLMNGLLLGNIRGGNSILPRKCGEVLLKCLTTAATVVEPSTDSYTSGKIIESKNEKSKELANPDSLNNETMRMRRRRGVLRRQEGTIIPFSEQPYHCFQEARKVLMADRAIKLEKIAAQKSLIQLTQQRAPESFQGGLTEKFARLDALQKRLTKLTILADINDPFVLKKFEDGQGDMNKPIYRYFSDQKWRQFHRKITMQRITQMFVVPDMLASIDPTVRVDISFKRTKVQSGSFIRSELSELPPRLQVQSYEAGERLTSILLLDLDVPNSDTDHFEQRCHFLAVNIPIQPTNPYIDLANLTDSDQLVHSWLPPSAIKGSPYHRLALLILDQAYSRESSSYERLDATLLKSSISRKPFSAREFISQYNLSPVGINMFRCIWDTCTDGVMLRAGYSPQEVNVEFRRPRPQKLPYRKKKSSRFR